MSVHPEDLDIAVVGAGLMGCGIAQVMAAAGATVRLHDPDPGALDGARSRMEADLRSRGEDPALAREVLLRDDLGAAVGMADWVFEAAPEDLALKQELFGRLEASSPPHCLLATNTSVMRVSEIAEGVRDPRWVVGTHWWNPAPLVPLVEVVGGERTDPSVVRRTMHLLEAVGKRPVHVRRDVPGFVGNRLQHALWRQAFALVEQGVCSPEDVDEVIRSSFGPRLTVLGPMENADLIGLDLTKQIHDYVLPTLDPPSATSPVLERAVTEGRLGAKSGEGLRAWTAEEASAARRRLADHLTARTPVVAEGAR